MFTILLLCLSFNHMQLAKLTEGDTKEMSQKPVVEIPMFSAVRHYPLWLVWDSFS